MLKNIVRAFVAFLFGQWLGIVSNILLVPLYLHVWSPQLYGEWLGLYAAVGYLATADLGIQTFALNRLTQAYSRGDLHDYRAIQHTAFAFHSTMSVAGLLLLAVVASTAPLDRWFGLALIDRNDAGVVVLLLGTLFLGTLPGSIIFGVYRTTGNLALSQWVANGSRTLTLVATVAVLLLHPTVLALAAAQLGSFLLVFALISLDIRRRHGALFPGFGAVRRDLVGPMLKQSLMFALITIAVAINMQGANVLVAGTMGGAAVALFAVTRTLANSIRQLVGLLVNSATTDVTRMDAMGDARRLRLAFRLLTFSSVAATIAVAASLWFEGESVMRVWTGDEIAPDAALLRLFLLYLVLQAPWMTASVLAMTTNRHRVLAMGYLASSVFGLALGAAFMRRYGLVAIPAGFLVAEAVVCFHFVIKDACVIAGESYGAFAARVWIGLALIFLATALVAGGVHRLDLPLVARWAVSGASCATLAAYLSYRYWLQSDDRQLVRSKLAVGMRWIGKAAGIRTV